MDHGLKRDTDIESNDSMDIMDYILITPRFIEGVLSR